MSLPYCPPGELPPHVRYDTHAGSVVNARTFGAIGDGLMHYITFADIAANPQWEGRYGTADTWDFVGLQEMIYAAYGTPGNLHSLGYSNLNRRCDIPPGDYRINRTLFLTAGIGVIFAGAGRFTTSIFIADKDKPILETNACYSVIKDIYFGYAGAQHCTTPTGLVEWNWGPISPAAGMAQLSVYDCLFHGSGWNNTIGFRASRDLYQGDNLVFHNTFFADCRYAGFATGDGAFNTLNIGFFHCNFQNCFSTGILMYGGNVGVYDCSFQNGHFSSTPQQTGFDIYLVSNAGSVCSVIEGCRSESSAFLHADSYHNVSVKGCSNLVSPPAWAPDTVYAVGAIVRARDASAFKDGRPYICATAGTSGATGAEPEWGGEDGLVDNTVVWNVYNYNTLEFDQGTIENCSFPWGRVKIGVGASCKVNNLVVSRDDWLWKGPDPVASPLEAAVHYTSFDRVHVVHGGGINQGSIVPWSLETYGSEPDHIEATAHHYLPPTTPLLWLRNCHRSGTQHRGARDVGLWPSRGHYADGTNEDLSANVLGIIGAVGPRHAPEVANAVGEPLIVQGGLSRGLGEGGDIRFRTPAPGSAGTVLNFPDAAVDRMRIKHNRVQVGVPHQLLKVNMTGRNALINPEIGDEIYNLTLYRKQVWNGFGWDDSSLGTMTWDPLTAFGSRLMAWWQVKDPSTLFQDTGLTTPAVGHDEPVAAITDKTSNGRTLLQATAAAMPRLKLNQALPGGHPCISHNGTDQWLKTALFDRDPPTTVICIFRGVSGWAMSSANGLATTIFINGGFQVFFYNGQNIGLNVDVATQFGCAIGTYDGPDSKFWVNGVRDDIHPVETPSGNFPKGITMGGDYASGSILNGEWVEALVVDGWLTDAERDYVNLYAQQYNTPEPFLIG